MAKAKKTKKKSASPKKAAAKGKSKAKPKGKAVKSSAKSGKPVKKSTSRKKVVAKTAAKLSSASSNKVKKSARPDFEFWAEFVTPLDDRVIVEVQVEERVTAGGLIIPDSSEVEGNNRGTVLVVGRGHRDAKGRLKPMDVRAGDQVLFAQHAGAKVLMMEKQLLILRESDLLGIVES